MRHAALEGHSVHASLCACAALRMHLSAHASLCAGGRLCACALAWLNMPCFLPDPLQSPFPALSQPSGLSEGTREISVVSSRRLIRVSCSKKRFKKGDDPGRIRTCILLICSQTRYPFRHRTSLPVWNFMNILFYLTVWLCAHLPCPVKNTVC